MSKSLTTGDACAMVIFGAGGDLTKRLLIPALYNMMQTGTLPVGFALIGVDHAQGNAQSWAKRLRAELEGFANNTASEFGPAKIDEKVWRELAASMAYVSHPGRLH